MNPNTTTPTISPIHSGHGASGGGPLPNRFGNGFSRAPHAKQHTSVVRFPA
jgi:hypothetical protein